jgi:hypothetical protein
MLALKFLLLLVLFALNLAGPGLLILRRLRWPPGEMFCASIALSQFIAFLLAFGLYCARVDARWYWLISIVGLLTTVAARGDLRRLWRSHTVQAQLRTYLLLLPLGLCMLALISYYAGGIWAGDWLEHYQRVLFFLQHHAIDEIFIDTYKLPARPPMMSVLTAAYMGQLGETSYAAFQLTFLLLNLLVVMPCVLLLPMLGARRRRMALPALIFLLAASPMMFQNLTWTWPRLLTTFYSLVAVAFYLRGWWKNDPVRMVAAFVSLAIGALVHYSVGPYIVVLLAHYAVIFVVPYVMKLVRPAKTLAHFPLRSWREPILAGVLSAAVLMTWFGWSLATYGREVTFGSNTTISDTAKFTLAQNAAKFFNNCFYTIVPHPIGLPDQMFWRNFWQPSFLGYLRDYMFTLYQQNILFNLGSIGWLIVRVQLARVPIARHKLSRDRRMFWWFFIVATTLLGIVVVGSFEVLGVAHACLQPMMFLGIVFLAASVQSIYRWARVLVLIACTVDFTLGIFLHATLQHRSFHYMPDPQGRPDTYVIAGGGGLNERAARAWNAKVARDLHFVGDAFDRSTVVVQIVFVEWFAITAYGFWYFCIAERRRRPLRGRQTWRAWLPRSPAPNAYLG